MPLRQLPRCMHTVPSWAVLRSNGQVQEMMLSPSEDDRTTSADGRQRWPARVRLSKGHLYVDMAFVDASMHYNYKTVRLDRLIQLNRDRLPAGPLDFDLDFPDWVSPGKRPQWQSAANAAMQAGDDVVEPEGSEGLVALQPHSRVRLSGVSTDGGRASTVSCADTVRRSARGPANELVLDFVAPNLADDKAQLACTRQHVEDAIVRRSAARVAEACAGSMVGALPDVLASEPSVSLQSVPPPSSASVTSRRSSHTACSWDGPRTPVPSTTGSVAGSGACPFLARTEPGVGQPSTRPSNAPSESCSTAGAADAADVTSSVGYLSTQQCDHPEADVAGLQTAFAGTCVHSDPASAASDSTSAARPCAGCPLEGSLCEGCPLSEACQPEDGLSAGCPSVVPGSPAACRPVSCLSDACPSQAGRSSVASPSSVACPLSVAGLSQACPSQACASEACLSQACASEACALEACPSSVACLSKACPSEACLSVASQFRPCDSEAASEAGMGESCGSAASSLTDDGTVFPPMRAPRPESFACYGPGSFDLSSPPQTPKSLRLAILDAHRDPAALEDPDAWAPLAAAADDGTRLW